MENNRTPPESGNKTQMSQSAPLLLYDHSGVSEGEAERTDTKITKEKKLSILNDFFI